jgi:hypothetical protein
VVVVVVIAVGDGVEGKEDAVTFDVWVAEAPADIGIGIGIKKGLPVVFDEALVSR